jgi:tape measure domain-containing protein
MLGGNLTVRLSLDDDAFNRGIDRAKRGVGGFSADVASLSRVVGRTESSIGMMGNTLRNVTMDIAILRYAFADLNDIALAIPRSLINSAAQFEKTTKMLEGLSKETDAASRKLQAMSDMKFLVNMAVSAPFDMKALSNSFVKFRAAGLDPTNNSLQALIDSVAKFGGGSDELNRASVAIAQMSGKGVISMEELRQQLGEAVPNAIQLMARGMGMGMAEMNKLISKGVVESQSALAKMFIQMRIENDGAAKAMMETWTGMSQALSTKWDLFKNDIAQAGFFDGAKDELKTLLEAFDSDQMKDISRKLGAALAQLTEMFAGSVQFILDNFDAIIAVLKTLGAALVLGGLAKFFGASERESSAFFEGIKRKEAELAEQHRKATAQKEADIKRLMAERESMMRQLDTLNSKQTAADISEMRSNQQKSREIQATYNRHVQAEQKLLQMRATAAQEVIAIQGRIEAAEARLEKARAQKKRQRDIKEEIAGLQELERAKQMEVESTRFAFEANKAKINQYQQEITALKERYREVMKNNGANSSAAQILRAEIAANDSKLKSLQATNIELGRLNKLQMASAGAAGILAAGIGRMTTALRGFVASMVTMTASIAGWTLLLGALSFAWSKIEEKIWGAERAQKAFNKSQKAIAAGKAGQEDVETTEKTIKDLEDKILKKEFKVDDSKMQGLSGLERIKEYQRQEKEFILNSRNEIERLKGDLAKAKNQVLAAEVEGESDFGSTLVRNAKIDGGSELSQAFKNVQEINNKIGAVISATDKESVELRNKLNAELKVATITLYDKEIETIQGEMKGQQNLLDTLQEGSKEYAIAQARMLSLYKTLDSAVREKDQFKAAPNLSGAGGEKVKKPKVEKIDALDRIRAEAEAAMASVDRADNAIATFESTYSQMLAKLESLRSSSKESIYKNLTDEDLQQVALDSALPKVVKEATSEMSKLAAETAKLDDELAASTASLGRVNSGVTEQFNDANRKAAQSIAIYEEAIKALQAKRNTLGSETARLGVDNDIERLRGAQAGEQANVQKRAQIELNALKKSEQDRMKAIAEAMETGTKARQTAFDNDLKQINETYSDQIALAFAAGEDITLIEEEKFKAIAQLRDKFEKDSFAGLNALKMQWMDVGQQLADASANWADSISNSIVEGFKTGRFEVREVLLGILNDVLKIMTQKSIAEPIANTLQAGASGLAGLLTGGAGGVATGVAGEVAGSAVEGGLGAGLFDGLQQSLGGVVTGMQGFLNSVLGTTFGLGDLAVQGAGEATAALVTSVAGMTAEQAATAAGIAAKTTETATVVTFQAGMMAAIASLAAFVAALQASAAATAASGATSGGGGLLASIASGFVASANGNIVTSAGAMPLQAYASGGIANRPQLSLFGEGRLPEAYVPLPDGRTIPVTLNAASFGFDKIQAMLAAMASAMAFMTGGLTSSMVQMRQSVTRVPEQAVIQGVGASVQSSGTQTANAQENAVGAGSGTYVAQQNLTIEINVQNDGEKTSGSSDFADRETAKALASRIKAVVKEELLTQKRPGGILSR